MWVQSALQIDFQNLKLIMQLEKWTKPESSNSMPIFNWLLKIYLNIFKIQNELEKGHPDHYF